MYLCICQRCYPTDLSVIAPPPPSEGFLCHFLLIIIIIIIIIIHLDEGWLVSMGSGYLLMNCQRPILPSWSSHHCAALCIPATLLLCSPCLYAIYSTISPSWGSPCYTLLYVTTMLNTVRIYAGHHTSICSEHCWPQELCSAVCQMKTARIWHGMPARGMVGLWEAWYVYMRGMGVHTTPHGCQLHFTPLSLRRMGGRGKSWSTQWFTTSFISKHDNYR